MDADPRGDSGKLKRTSGTPVNSEIAAKLIRSSRGKKLRNNQEGSEDVLEDSGYAESLENSPCTAQSMDLDENSSGNSFEERESEYVCSSGNSQCEELKGFPHNIKVDDDNTEMSAENKITTGEKRFYAENECRCTIEIDNKKKWKEQEEVILKMSCALLNSGGGLLIMEIANFQGLETEEAIKCAPPLIDEFWKPVEPKLQAMASPSKYHEVYDRHVDSDQVLLFIKAPQHHCSVDMNLYFPGDHQGKIKGTYDDAVELLKKKSQSKRRKSLTGDLLGKLPKVDKNFKFKEKLAYHESKQIQLKGFTSDTILDINNRSQCDAIRVQVSAFANASGGVILVGVKDDGEVIGFKIKNNSKEDIEERLTSLMAKMCCDVPLKRKAHWDMDYVPVSGCDKEPKAVLVIQVACMERFGGVFAKCPKSYELRRDQNGNSIVHELPFNEWKERILSREDQRTENKATEELCKRFDKMQISNGRFLLSVKDAIQRIRDAFFTVEDGCPVTPKGFQSTLSKKARAVIRRIQETWCPSGKSKGLLAAKSSWHEDMKGKPVESVICDLLLISPDVEGLHLFTLINGGDSEALLQYSREAAISVKRRLVQDGGCGRKFYVFYHVMSCDDTEELPLTCNWYPPEYRLMNREKVNEVLKALVVVCAAVPSSLSSKMGVSFFNLLTEKQFQVVYEQIHINKELWVKGAAGTGKTFVAIKFMRELHRREKLETDEILCVCENQGIVQQIRETKLCNVVCRKTFIEAKNSFPEARHVVMDEVHKYEQQSHSQCDGSWIDKARKVVRRRDPKNPGYLWLFTDKCQTDHPLPTGAPPESQQTPSVTLTTVIRNSRQIFNYSRKHLFHADVKQSLNLGHDFEGERVQFISYSKDKKSKAECLNEILSQLFEQGYSCRDIAVLFAKQDCISDTLSGQLNVPTCDARNNRSDIYVVVSTVNKYSGLDRPVVIIFDIDCSIPRHYKPDHFKYCAETRAMVKLLIVQCKSCRSTRSIADHFSSAREKN